MEGSRKTKRSLYFFDYVDRKASDVVASLARRPASIFQAATDAAIEKTEQFRDQLRVDVADLEIGKDITIELGQPEDRGGVTYIPITWRASTQSGLFPYMDAEIEITPLSDFAPLTQVGASGHYQPPLGLLGAMGDSVFGHRIAEATIRNFVIDLAKRLNHEGKPAD